MLGYKLTILIKGNQNLTTIMNVLEGAAEVVSMEVVHDVPDDPKKRKPKGTSDRKIVPTKMGNDFIAYLKSSTIKTLTSDDAGTWCLGNGYSHSSGGWAITLALHAGVIKKNGTYDDRKAIYELVR